jgi:hypothetical protein
VGGWRMEFTQPGRHERKVERFIRDVRDRVRTVIDSLKYRLPKKLYPVDLAMLCRRLAETGEKYFSPLRGFLQSQLIETVNSLPHMADISNLHDFLSKTVICTFKVGAKNFEFFCSFISPLTGNLLPCYGP